MAKDAPFPALAPTITTTTTTPAAASLPQREAAPSPWAGGGEVEVVKEEEVGEGEVTMSRHLDRPLHGREGDRVLGTLPATRWCHAARRRAWDGWEWCPRTR